MPIFSLCPKCLARLRFIICRSRRHLVNMLIATPVYAIHEPFDFDAYEARIDDYLIVRQRAYAHAER